MPPEEWRPVPGHPAYEVSSEGRVRKGGRVSTPGRNGRRGYRRISLSTGGQQQYVYAHRLICEVFHGPTPPGAVVAHGDGDPGNNATANPRWATPTENSADRWRHGTRRTTLSPEMVASIRERCAAGESQSAVARAVGVSSQAVNHIILGRRWSTPSPPAPHPSGDSQPGPGGAFSP